MLKVTKGDVIDISFNDLGQSLPAHGTHLVHPDVGPLQRLLDHLDPCFYATMCRVILGKTGLKINTSLSGQDTITANYIDFPFRQGLHDGSVLVRQAHFGHTGFREEPVESIQHTVCILTTLHHLAVDHTSRSTAKDKHHHFMDLMTTPCFSFITRYIALHRAPGINITVIENGTD